MPQDSEFKLLFQTQNSISGMNRVSRVFYKY